MCNAPVSLIGEVSGFPSRLKHPAPTPRARTLLQISLTSLTGRCGSEFERDQKPLTSPTTPTKPATPVAHFNRGTQPLNVR